MGMTILQAKQKLHENWMLLTTCGRDTELTQALSIAETVLGNYDDTLKADMVAMLTELQLEIEECVDGAEGSPQFEQGITIARVQAVDIIQQKINELKGENKHE